MTVSGGATSYPRDLGTVTTLFARAGRPAVVSAARLFAPRRTHMDRADVNLDASLLMRCVMRHKVRFLFVFATCFSVITLGMLVMSPSYEVSTVLIGGQPDLEPSTNATKRSSDSGISLAGIAESEEGPAGGHRHGGPAQPRRTGGTRHALDLRESARRPDQLPRHAQVVGISAPSVSARRRHPIPAPIPSRWMMPSCGMMPWLRRMRPTRWSAVR